MPFATLAMVSELTLQEGRTWRSARLENLCPSLSLSC